MKIKTRGPKKFFDMKFKIKTEIWDFNNSDTRTVDPNLPNGDYRYGIAIYLVPNGYCSNL